MSKDKNEKYTVGYKKPPQHSRFKPGQSGNPKGRPVGRTIIELSRLSEEALWQTFLDAAQQPVNLTENGVDTTIPLIMAMVKGMARDAIKGDPKARKEFLDLLAKATKGKDQIVHDIYDRLTDFKERRFHALQNKGSLTCYETMCSWFKAKKSLRDLEDEDRWPYEDGEPISTQDWDMFMEQYDYLKSNPSENLVWPPKYPSQAEERRFENMTPTELAQVRLDEFEFRLKMREKEGLEKWPYTGDEPVNDKDWKHFRQHIADCLTEKPDPAPWPPAYWDEMPDM